MKIWGQWVRLLGSRETGEALALCRILCGLGCLISVVATIPTGTWILLWTDKANGGYRTLEDLPWLVELLGGANPMVIGSLALAAFAAGVSLTVGWHSRISAALALLGINTLIRVNPHDGSAYDSLLTNQLWLLVFAASGATWSVDCYRRHRRWKDAQEILAWPRYLMVFQLVVCYFSTGIQKISIHWLPGGDLHALHYILQDTFWRRWDLSAHLNDWLWATKLNTVFSWWFEVLAPLVLVSLYFRRTRNQPGRLRRWSNKIDFRTMYALYGIVFHVGIHLFMRVGPFSWIILAYYPALWSGTEWRRLRRSPTPPQG